MPPTKYISPLFRVEYAFQHTLVLQCMDCFAEDGTAGCDTSLSDRAMLSDIFGYGSPLLEERLQA